MEQQETMILNNCTTNDSFTEQPNGSCIQQFVPLLRTGLDYDQFFEGSSMGSILSDGPPSFDSDLDCGSQKVSALDQCSDKIMLLGDQPSLTCKEPSCSNYLCRQEMDLIYDCGELAEEKEEESLKVPMRPEGAGYRSKNLITERKRRDRLKDRLFTLRGLVPKITKMDRLSTLVDSISFIEELEKKVKELQDELKDMEGNNKNSQLEISNLNLISKRDKAEKKVDIDTGDQLIIQESKHKHDLLSDDQTTREMEARIEVKQISVKEFFVKFFCEKKRGGFTRMIEAMNSLGVRVTDANVTTFKGMSLNILKVEADNEDVQAQKVKDILLDLTRYNGRSE